MTTTATATTATAPATAAMGSVPLQQAGNLVQPAAFGLVPQNFAELTECAARYAKSGIVPQSYRGKPEDCFIAASVAYRANLDPLYIMQQLYVVNGNPTFSSKYLIAAFNACGRFTSMRYRMTGERGTESRGCVAYATERGTGEPVEGPEVTMKMAKDEGWLTRSGSKWRTMPEVMLRYRAAAFLVRTVAPELAMGISVGGYDDEERPPVVDDSDVIDVPLEEKTVVGKPAGATAAKPQTSYVPQPAASAEPEF